MGQYTTVDVPATVYCARWSTASSVRPPSYARGGPSPRRLHPGLTMNGSPVCSEHGASGLAVCSPGRVVLPRPDRPLSYAWGVAHRPKGPPLWMSCLPSRLRVCRASGLSVCFACLRPGLAVLSGCLSVCLAVCGACRPAGPSQSVCVRGWPVLSVCCVLSGPVRLGCPFVCLRAGPAGLSVCLSVSGTIGPQPVPFVVLIQMSHLLKRGRIHAIYLKY